MAKIRIKYQISLSGMQLRCLPKDKTSTGMYVNLVGSDCLFSQEYKCGLEQIFTSKQCYFTQAATRGLYISHTWSSCEIQTTVSSEYFIKRRVHSVS